MKNKHTAELLKSLTQKKTISTDSISNAFKEIMLSRDETDFDFGAMLFSLSTKKFDVSHFSALVDVISDVDNIEFNNYEKAKAMLPIGSKLIGLAGSGKKDIKTINITTSSAIVAASCGAYIAKAVSGATSSLTGSSDFLTTVDIKTDMPVYKTIDILQRAGLGFFSIKDQIPNFDKKYNGRVHTTTILSLGLPALLIPVSVNSIIYGLSNRFLRLSCEILQKYGYYNSYVINSIVEGKYIVDELLPGSISYVSKYSSDSFYETEKINISKLLNIRGFNYHNLLQDTSLNRAMNVAKAVNALKGIGNKDVEDVLCVNASYMLCISEICEDLKEGYIRAKSSIKNGKAYRKLEEMVEVTGGSKENLNRLVQL